MHLKATRTKTLGRQGAGSAKSRNGADLRGYNRSIALPVALMSDIAQKRMICSIDAFGDAGIVSRSKTRVCWVISLRASELHSILSTWAAKPSSNIDEAGVSPCKNSSNLAGLSDYEQSLVFSLSPASSQEMPGPYTCALPSHSQVSRPCVSACHHFSLFCLCTEISISRGFKHRGEPFL